LPPALVAIKPGLLILDIIEKATRNELKILFSIPFEHMIFNKFLENKVIHQS
jgi:hypothetical protein